MGKKTLIVIGVLVGAVVAAGLGVLIWWLVRPDEVLVYETIRLPGTGIENVTFTAAFTRVDGKGDMFWWFYPTLAASPTSRPVLMWLNGPTGVSPSFLANFGMVGPQDTNWNRRNESWINDYNLLFVDAPLGTGFSVQNSNTNALPNVDENVEHLLRTVQSFYDLHNEFRNSSLYIYGHADGSQLALPLAIKLYEEEDVSSNFKGVILGNPVVSPGSVLTKLGFYLEELAYIDGKGRIEIENYTNATETLVRSGSYEEAFSYFRSLGDFINQNAGAVAVNINRIVERVTRASALDYFGERTYLERIISTNITDFMEKIVAPGLGISSEVRYDGQREAAIQAFNSTFMKPIIDKVEYILVNTSLSVNICNGNLDAVSNTPGQLDWINNLNWSNQSQFLNAPRQTLVFNRLVEGYFRESERLSFYWINVAGQLAPLDNPVAMRRVLNRILN